MSQQLINVDTTVDLLRAAFDEVNQHFTELYDGRPFISIKDAPYSAIGDGVTDDTAAIIAASNAASTSGKRLYFPPGTYAYASEMALTSNNVGDVLDWVGCGNAVLKSISANGVARISMAMPIVRIEGIKFDFNGANVPVSNWGLLANSATTELHLKDCVFYGGVFESFAVSLSPRRTAR